MLNRNNRPSTTVWLYKGLFYLAIIAILTDFGGYLYSTISAGFDVYATFLSALYFLTDCATAFFALRKNLLGFIIFFIASWEDYSFDRSLGVTFHNMSFTHAPELFLMHCFFVASLVYCLLALGYFITHFILRMAQ